MTVFVRSDADAVHITDPQRKLSPATKSTLRLYGFRQGGEGLSAESHGRRELVLKVVTLLTETDVALGPVDN